MIRDIVTTIEFSNGYLSINALESLSNNTVEIFQARGPISKAHIFIKESISQINTLIGGSVQDVAIVINPSEKVDGKIEVVSEKINIVGRDVRLKDIENLTSLIKQKNQSMDREIILVQPLRFRIIGKQTNDFISAPLNEIGETLVMTAAMTSVKTSVVKFIKDIIQVCNLNITQMLLKPQTISQNNLSKNAISAGAVVVHVGESQSFVTINKNNGTVASISFYDTGFSSLVKGVAKVFGCTEKEARNLIHVYGSLKDEVVTVIHTQQKGIEQHRYTNEDLRNLIAQFIRRIFVLSNKFLAQKGVQNLPVVLSGQITRITAFEKFANEIFQTNISIYQPMTFIETNHENHVTQGFMNWNNAMKFVMHTQYSTSLLTNPNGINSLKRQTKQKLFARLANRIGGKYDWHS